jgi:hypothetical protein
MRVAASPDRDTVAVAVAVSLHERDRPQAPRRATRSGIERIETIVHTVSSPAYRKFAPEGPRSRPGLTR